MFQLIRWWIGVNYQVYTNYQGPLPLPHHLLQQQRQLLLTMIVVRREAFASASGGRGIGERDGDGREQSALQVQGCAPNLLPTAQLTVSLVRLERHISKVE